MNVKLEKMLRELESERISVRVEYNTQSQISYRDGVLEGLRLAEVIAKEVVTLEKRPCFVCQHKNGTIKCLTCWYGINSAKNNFERSL